MLYGIFHLRRFLIEETKNDQKLECQDDEKAYHAWILDSTMSMWMLNWTMEWWNNFIPRWGDEKNYSIIPSKVHWTMEQLHLGMRKQEQQHHHFEIHMNHRTIFFCINIFMDYKQLMQQSSSPLQPEMKRQEQRHHDFKSQLNHGTTASWDEETRTAASSIEKANCRL